MLHCLTLPGPGICFLGKEAGQLPKSDSADKAPGAIERVRSCACHNMVELSNDIYCHNNITDQYSSIHRGIQSDYIQ